MSCEVGGWALCLVRWRAFVSCEVGGGALCLVRWKEGLCVL